MGVHIQVQTADGKDHPDWDWVRYAGDREFADWTAGLPTQNLKPPPSSWADDIDYAYRPVDFPAWLAALPADRPNPDRFPALLRLLEANPDLWIRLSF